MMYKDSIRDRLNHRSPVDAVLSASERLGLCPIMLTQYMLGGSLHGHDAKCERPIGSPDCTSCFYEWLDSKAMK